MDARAKSVGMAVVVALGLVLVETAGAVPLPAPGNVVGYYPLNELGGATALDASGNNYHGSFLAGATRNAGIELRAAEFPGLPTSNFARVDLPSNPVLDNVTDSSYTLSAWVRPDTVPPGSGAANDANYGIVIKTGFHSGLYYTNARQFRFGQWHAGLTGMTDFPATGTYAPGLWTHVVGAVSMATNTINLYINGAPAGSAGVPSLYDYGSNPFHIGIANPGGGSYSWPMDGRIDEVAIWNTALSAAQVQQLHNAYRVGLQVVADYRDDYRGPTPLPGWRYLRNPSGNPIGTSAGYVPLLWDGVSQYDTNGLPGLPDASPGSYTSLNALGGHPGEGSTQAGDGLNHYAIAEYTVSDPGYYFITDSLLSATGGGARSLDLRVYVNDLLMHSEAGITGTTTFHYLPLGSLAVGDRIYVAVGPNGVDWDDSFLLDFTLAMTPEPGTLGLLTLGLAALARKRRMSPR
jgi:hypothetical protein